MLALQRYIYIYIVMSRRKGPVEYSRRFARYVRMVPVEELSTYGINRCDFTSTACGVVPLKCRYCRIIVRVLLAGACMLTATTVYQYIEGRLLLSVLAEL